MRGTIGACNSLYLIFPGNNDSYERMKEEKIINGFKREFYRIKCYI